MLFIMLMDEIFTPNNQKYNKSKIDLLHKSLKKDAMNIDAKLALLLDQELRNPREKIIQNLLEFSKTL